MKGYCKKKLAKKSSFDARSFRWIKRGRTKILIGCPRGKWNVKSERCRVGTRAYETLTPGRC